MHFVPCPKGPKRAKSSPKALPKESAKRLAAKKEGTWVPKAKPKPNAVNSKRRKRERLRGHGTPEFDAWIKAQHCVVCGYTPCDPAHMESGGMGRKADFANIYPCCRLHHAEQHMVGVASFEKNHGINLKQLARNTQARWKNFVARNRGAE